MLFHPESDGILGLPDLIWVNPFPQVGHSGQITERQVPLRWIGNTGSVADSPKQSCNERYPITFTVEELSYTKGFMIDVKFFKESQHELIGVIAGNAEVFLNGGLSCQCLYPQCVPTPYELCYSLKHLVCQGNHLPLVISSYLSNNR